MERPFRSVAPRRPRWNTRRCRWTMQIVCLHWARSTRSVDKVEKSLSQCVAPWNPARAPRTSGIHVWQGHAQQVPNSVGIEPPKLKAPANAADCHMHTYDPARFPMPPNPRTAPTNATVEDYRLLQKRIGTTRVVIVQPRNYATDNRVTLYAISQLGPNARGVAVVTPAIADAELKAFHAGGIRGIRFS